MALAYTITVCYAMGSRWTDAWAAIGVSTAALAQVIAAGYVFNDVCDWKVDAVNAPQRPIAAGRVRRRAGVGLAAIMGATGLALAALCRPAFVLALAGVAAGLLIYDLYSKRLGLGKQILAAALMTSIYGLAYAQAGGFHGRRSGTLVVFPVWMFCTAFGYECLKDIRDAAGDRAVFPRANWLQRNPERAAELARRAIAVGSMILLLPAWAGCGRVYLVCVIPAVVLGLATFVQPTRRAMAMVYMAYVIVGIAAMADLLVYGW
jgi:4-hydroxybenzoate polyprenyltransferase